VQSPSQPKTSTGRSTSGRAALVAAALSAIVGITSLGFGAVSIYRESPYASGVSAKKADQVSDHNESEFIRTLLPEQNRALYPEGTQSSLLPPIVSADAILRSQLRPSVPTLPDPPPRQSFAEITRPGEISPPSPTNSEPGVPEIEISPEAFLYVGDSISVGLHEVMAAPQENLYGRIGASSGAIVDEIIPLMREGRFSQRHVIVALGTNDSLGIESQFAENVDRFVAEATNAGKCVIWLTIHRVQNGNNWESFNEKLREASAKSRYLKLVDWAALAKSRSDYLYQDGIHIKPDGYRAIWRLVQTEIQACPTG